MVLRNRKQLEEMVVSYNFTEGVKITNPDQSAELGYSLWSDGSLSMYESFYVAYLSNSNVSKGTEQFEYRTNKKVGQGGINFTSIDIRIVLGLALKTLSAGIILYHNHPSGNPEPSKADKDLTKRIVELAKIHEVKVLDHIIILPSDKEPFYTYTSFLELGLL